MHDKGGVGYELTLSAISLVFQTWPGPLTFAGQALGGKCVRYVEPRILASLLGKRYEINSKTLEKRIVGSRLG